MRILEPMLLVAMAATTASAQRASLEQGAPKVPCRFERLSSMDRVAGIPSFEELMRFDLTGLTEHRVFFPTRTIVSVSRRIGAWSCVSGSMNVPTSGSPFRTGWMKTVFLEPLKPGTGSDAR